MNNYHLLLMEINIHTMRKRQKQSTRNRLIIDNRNSQNTCWAMLKEVKNKIKIKVFNQSIDQLVVSKKKKKYRNFWFKKLLLLLLSVDWFESKWIWISENEMKMKQVNNKSSQVKSTQNIFFPLQFSHIDSTKHTQKKTSVESIKRKKESNKESEGGWRKIRPKKKKNHRSKWSLVFSFFLF